jgi:predicted N-acetyltransferase YhbS
MDGPRALRSDEWDQLSQVVSTVFRSSMFEEYPQLFDKTNQDNLRVVAEDGKVVCHVGQIERPASLAGCRIDVACIGAVATLDEYRGRGFASLAFQDACDKAARDGVDVMLISGGRGLYTRVGCRQVGQDADYVFTPESAERLAGVRAPAGAYEVAPVGSDRAAELMSLYAAEAVRFIRRADDWRMAFECGVVMNTASDFWGVSAGGVLVAYLIVHQPQRARSRPEDPLTVRVVEFAGVRPAVLAAVPALLRHYGAARLTLHVQGSDPVFSRFLPALGAGERRPSGASGTLRVINFPQLMERCRPLLAERLGHAIATRLTFHAESPPGSAAGGFAIRAGADEVRVADLASLAVLLFGSHRPLAAPDTRPSGGALLAALERALPLPSLWYGISYV